jgi:cupin fold WbuC family metalloprotein
MVVLRGSVVEDYYDDSRSCVASYELSAGGPVCAMNIPAGQWHTLRALESGTVILEMKDGAYEPISPEDVMKL